MSWRTVRGGVPTPPENREKPMRRLLLWAGAALALYSHSPADDLKHTTDTPAEVKQRVASGKAVLVDVREPEEWKEGHLAVAVLLPLKQLKTDSASADFESQLAKSLAKDKIVYAHCKAGGRCLLAGEILKQAGYDVRPLKQGYEELLELGFEKAK